MTRAWPHGRRRLPAVRSGHCRSSGRRQTAPPAAIGSPQVRRRAADGSSWTDGAARRPAVGRPWRRPGLPGGRATPQARGGGRAAAAGRIGGRRARRATRVRRAGHALEDTWSRAPMQVLARLHVLRRGVRPTSAGSAAGRRAAERRWIGRPPTGGRARHGSNAQQGELVTGSPSRRPWSSPQSPTPSCRRCGRSPRGTEWWPVGRRG